jgi:hypothetical protein
MLGVSNETGSCAIFKISRTFSAGKSISSPISSGAGSRPKSCNNLPAEKVREILKIAQEPVSLETPIGEEDDSHLGARTFSAGKSISSPISSGAGSRPKSCNN